MLSEFFQHLQRDENILRTRGHHTALQHHPVRSQRSQAFTAHSCQTTLLYVAKRKTLLKIVYRSTCHALPHSPVCELLVYWFCGCKSLRFVFNSADDVVRESVLWMGKFIIWRLQGVRQEHLKNGVWLVPKMTRVHEKWSDNKWDDQTSPQINQKSSLQCTHESSLPACSPAMHFLFTV